MSTKDDCQPGRRAWPNDDGDLWLQEGEYGQDRHGVWHARPFGMSSMGSLENHDVTEHDDGTITVSPSILMWDETSRWHGYLERGRWRRVA